MSDYDVNLSASTGVQNQDSREIIKRKDQLGKDEFFKLLITQLKYQDPLEPMKDQQFIAQMAQFSSLEQMQQLNKSFEMMLILQDKMLFNQTIAQTFNLVGSNVKACLSESGELISGSVERIKLVNGWPTLVVSGIDVDLEEIIEICSRTAGGRNDGQENPEQSAYLV